MLPKLLIVLAVFALPLQYDASAEPAPLMTERGKLLYSEDFTNPSAKTWRIAKGKWEIVDNALKGVELKADKHPGVIRHHFPFTDAVIQFEVCVNGCKQTTFSINDAKEHLARVLFTKSGFCAQKDDHDHAGPDKAKVFGRCRKSFRLGEWHTVVIEFKGETMVTTVDETTIAGTDALIGTQKANFGFTVVGESASYRSLKVWEAKENRSWEETKKKLLTEKK